MQLEFYSFPTAPLLLHNPLINYFLRLFYCSIIAVTLLFTNSVTTLSSFIALFLFTTYYLIYINIFLLVFRCFFICLPSLFLSCPFLIPSCYSYSTFPLPFHCSFTAIALLFHYFYCCCTTHALLFAAVTLLVHYPCTTLPLLFQAVKIWHAAACLFYRMYFLWICDVLAWCDFYSSSLCNLNRTLYYYEQPCLVYS